MSTRVRKRPAKFIEDEESEDTKAEGARVRQVKKKQKVAASPADKKTLRKCERAGCSTAVPICFANGSDRCCGSGNTSRWYHLSSGEHFCNDCFDFFYRSHREGYPQLSKWKKEWSSIGRTEANLKTFMNDQYLPYWVQCNKCGKWRQLSKDLELTEDFVKSYSCGMTSRSQGQVVKDQESMCDAPEDERAGKAMEPFWINTLVLPPFLKCSPAAPLLTKYFPDGVGMSATSAMPTEKNTEVKLHANYQPFIQPDEYTKAMNLRPDMMEADELQQFPEFSKEQQMYIGLRNIIVTLWNSSPKEWLTVDKCVPFILCRGLVRIRCIMEVDRIIMFLTRKGLVNTGLIRDIPSTGILPPEFNRMKALSVGAQSSIGSTSQVLGEGATPQYRFLYRSLVRVKPRKKRSLSGGSPHWSSKKSRLNRLKRLHRRTIATSAPATFSEKRTPATSLATDTSLEESDASTSVLSAGKVHATRLKTFHGNKDSSETSRSVEALGRCKAEENGPENSSDSSAIANRQKRDRARRSASKNNRRHTVAGRNKEKEISSERSREHLAKRSLGRSSSAKRDRNRRHTVGGSSGEGAGKRSGSQLSSEVFTTPTRKKSARIESRSSADNAVGSNDREARCSNVSGDGTIAADCGSSDVNSDAALLTNVKMEPEENDLYNSQIPFYSETAIFSGGANFNGYGANLFRAPYVTLQRCESLGAPTHDSSHDENAHSHGLDRDSHASERSHDVNTDTSVLPFVNCAIANPIGESHVTTGSNQSIPEMGSQSSPLVATARNRLDDDAWADPGGDDSIFAKSLLREISRITKPCIKAKLKARLFTAVMEAQSDQFAAEDA